MENLKFGIEIMVIGFTFVMITLYLLYFILKAFSRVFEYQNKRQQIKMKAVTSAPLQATMNGTAPEIVAAITVALSACLDKPANEFRIVSIQPQISGLQNSSWAFASRRNLMGKRQDMIMRREKK